MSVQESKGGDALDQLPAALSEWLALERFHLYKIGNYQRLEWDPAFDTSYLPQRCGVFRLPCFLVRRKNLHMFGSQQQDADSMRFYSDATPDGSVLFPIHPLALSDYQSFLLRVDAHDAEREGIRFWAVPTSSTRTLLVWLDGVPDSAVFVKTSLSSPAFGDRRIRRPRAARSIGLSALVAAERDELPPQLSYFPECLAFTARMAPGTGAIIRTIPRRVVGGDVRVAPLFSLLGGEEMGREPLLLTMLDRVAVPAVQLVDEMLCKPFAKIWLELCLRSGWVLEAHAQDLLLELSPSLLPTGTFYYRDFEGMQVDWELRRRCGRPASDELPNAWQWHEAYDTWGPHPYCDLTWFKWRISLVQFLHVLTETELSLQGWHQRGLIGGPGCAPGELTMAFSRHMFDVIEQMFGARISSTYNIHPSLNRFLMLLAKLRREVIGAPLAASTELAA